MRETIYVKRGKRYKPIYEYDAAVCDSFPEGSHLVVSEPGSQIRRFRVDPDKAPVMAAIMEHRDKIIKVITEQMRMKPARTVDERHKRAWAAYCEVAGDDETLLLEGKSIMEIYEAFEKAIMDKVER